MFTVYSYLPTRECIILLVSSLDGGEQYMPCVVLTAGGAAIARSAAAAASASTGGGAADARRVLLKGRWRTRVQKVLSACKVQGPL